MQFPLPDPEPGAVVLQMSMSGICGTDKHTFRGEVMQYAGTPHERQIEYPLICGHENVGTVAATGGEVLDSEGQPLRTGDRVVPAANVSCGECWYCRNGQPVLHVRAPGGLRQQPQLQPRAHLFGGWSEYMYLLPGTQLFRVPDELPDHVAVLTEPMAVTHGFERARRLNDTFAETVVVFGVGPLGMCHLIKARLMGAGQLIAIDRFPSRLDRAGAFGANMTLDAAELESDELIARVREATGGRGADMVLDCTRRARHLRHQPADGPGRRHRRRSRRIRRHGAGADQPQRRHLHQERQRDRRRR